MRIISYNINGIRAAMKKGLMDWLATDPGDIICLQEVKAERSNIDQSLFNNLGYHDYWYSAQKQTFYLIRP